MSESPETTMIPEDVPAELVSAFHRAHLMAALDESEPTRALLAHFLPAHEAMVRDRFHAMERGLIERDVRTKVAEELRADAAELEQRAQQWQEGSPTPGTLRARAAQLTLAATCILRRLP